MTACRWYAVSSPSTGRNCAGNGSRPGQYRDPRRSIIVRTALLGALIAGMPGTGLAQAWPDRPVRMVVPFPPGGGTDTSARLLAERLATVWKQTVVVENVPGAAGSIGAARIARSQPDGHNLLFAPSGVYTANPQLYADAGYETLKDFTPVSTVATGPLVLVVPANSPFRTVADVIAAARAQPGKVVHGHGGVGSQTQLTGERFLAAAGIDMLGVSYKGEVPALASLVGGESQFSAGNLAAVLGHVNGGRLRALAVTSRSPSPQLPNVPTVGQTLPGFEAYSWFGIAAPRGTPPVVIDTIYRETRKAADTADFRERLAAQGMSVVASTPQAMTQTIERETQIWGKLIRERSLKPQ
jgi:tripartite-type tricarboxylate transporter receptor subunit TctC